MSLQSALWGLVKRTPGGVDRIDSDGERKAQPGAKVVRDKWLKLQTAKVNSINISTRKHQPGNTGQNNLVRYCAFFRRWRTDQSSGSLALQDQGKPSKRSATFWGAREVEVLQFSTETPPSL